MKLKIGTKIKIILGMHKNRIGFIKGHDSRKSHDSRDSTYCLRLEGLSRDVWLYS